MVEYPIEFRDQPNRIIVRCIPAAASPEPKVPGGLEADFRYFQVNSITGFCELIHIITDKLDPCAMLMLKHLIAAKFLEDHGNSPALLGYDCLGSYEGLDCLEYVVYNTEESSAESLTVPVKVYNELSAMTLPRLDTLFPKAVWSEWNERTAKDVWAKLD